jgi:4-carboxymuconolactone decarboxylase
MNARSSRRPAIPAWQAAGTALEGVDAADMMAFLCTANGQQQNDRESHMAKAPPSARRDRIKNFTPALVDYTNDVVYGDLWERKGLSKRDRSLITVAALVATYRPEQLVSHLTRAVNNGVTQEEITEVITHMAFYAGWPAAMSAAQVAYTVLVEGNKGV